MPNPRLSRAARVSLTGVAFTMTVSAGTVTIQPTAARGVASHTITLTTARTSAATAAATTETPVKADKKQSKVAKQRVMARKAVKVAKRQLGDPYRYGATGPGAFDCSGLVQFAWRKAGVRIPRVTTSQYQGIKKKVSWSDLRLGDLLFFHGKGHVGMYVGHGKMIHSPHTGAVVRIDKLSDWRKATFDGAVRPGA
ncbi:MAG TPA: C40 family peptidase [Thermopolyspora sp.]